MFTVTLTAKTNRLDAVFSLFCGSMVTMACILQKYCDVYEEGNYRPCKETMQNHKVVIKNANKNQRAFAIMARLVSALAWVCILPAMHHSAVAQSLTAAAPIQLARAEAPRFISLKPASANKHRALQSDRQSLSKGFMRLDKSLFAHRSRARTNPVLVTRPLASEEKDDKSAAAFADASLVNNGRVASRKAGFSWPLSNRAEQYVSSPYGQRKDPFTGKPAFHGGIDIAAATGTAVLASADGVVTATGEKGRFGNHVALRHADGSESLYGHLSRESVRVGARVRQGQKIGEVGSTGRSTGPHLDFRIKQNGQTVNPLAKLNLRAAPSKLKPELQQAMQKWRRGKGLAQTASSARVIQVH